MQWLRIIQLALAVTFVSIPLSVSSGSKDFLANSNEGPLRVCDPYSEGVEEIRAALWLPVGPKDARRVTYVLGSPWCPFCHHVYKFAASERNDHTEFRFLLFDMASSIDLENVASALWRGPEDLAQVFERQPRIRSERMTEEKREMAVSATLFNSIVLEKRHRPQIEYFESNIKNLGATWASPMTFDLKKLDSGFKFLLQYAGMPQPTGRDNSFTTDLGESANERLKRVELPRWENWAQEIQIPTSGQIKVHSLPTTDSPALCLEEGSWVKVNSRAKLENGNWLKFDAFEFVVSQSGVPMPVHGYIHVQGEDWP